MGNCGGVSAPPQSNGNGAECTLKDASALLWPQEELFATMKKTVGSVESLRGPHPRSNWLPIGYKDSVACVGGWPFQIPMCYSRSEGGDNAAEGAAKAKSILKAGVTTYVNLTEEVELPTQCGYGRWAPRLLEMQDAMSGDISVAKLRFDIKVQMPDGGVGDDDELANFLAKLINEFGDPKRKIYVHCYGGHGRAGVVACALLCILYNPKVLRDVPEELKKTWARADIKSHNPARSKYTPEAWDIAEGAVAVFNRFHAERVHEDRGHLHRFPHSAAQIETVVRIAAAVGPFKKLCRYN